MRRRRVAPAGRLLPRPRSPPRRRRSRRLLRPGSRRRRRRSRRPPRRRRPRRRRHPRRRPRRRSRPPPRDVRPVVASARAPEDLYGLPLEEFTPARDALAKELKAAGRKDEAAEVKSLRKPSLAAWALNRAAREHADAIERLRAAGADLRAAQDEAL